MKDERDATFQQNKTPKVTNLIVKNYISSVIYMCLLFPLSVSVPETFSKGLCTCVRFPAQRLRAWKSTLHRRQEKFVVEGASPFHVCAESKSSFREDKTVNNIGLRARQKWTNLRVIDASSKERNVQRFLATPHWKVKGSCSPCFVTSRKACCLR